MMDPNHLLHSACDRRHCWARVLRGCAEFAAVDITWCNHCPNVSSIQNHDCILRVQPDVNVELAAQAMLSERDVSAYRCEECGGQGARQVKRIDVLPRLLLIHINKTPGQELLLGCPKQIRLYARDYIRVAAVHHHP